MRLSKFVCELVRRRPPQASARRWLMSCGDGRKVLAQGVRQKARIEEGGYFAPTERQAIAMSIESGEVLADRRPFALVRIVSFRSSLTSDKRLLFTQLFVNSYASRLSQLSFQPWSAD